MDKLILIWSLILSLPLIGEYVAWGRGTPLNYRRIALCIVGAFCGWALSAGLVMLLLIQLAALVLLVAQAATVVLIVMHLHAAWMWLRSWLAVRR